MLEVVSNKCKYWDRQAITIALIKIIKKIQQSHVKWIGLKTAHNGMERFKGIKTCGIIFLSFSTSWNFLLQTSLTLVLSNVDAIGSRLGSCDESARAASWSKHMSKLRSLAGLAFCEELVYFVVKAKNLWIFEVGRRSFSCSVELELSCQGENLLSF